MPHLGELRLESVSNAVYASLYWRKEEEIHMKKIVMLAALAGTASVSMADVVLTVDLSVVNQITITGTAGLSSGAQTSGTGVGVYLQNFFSANGVAINTTGTGTFRSAAGTVGDGTPGLYRDTATDAGLNVWTFATTQTFVVGQQAFSGIGTWNVTATQYASLLASNAGGNVYAPADSADDVASAVLIGQWAVVPTPGAAAVLGLGGLAMGRRRRA